MRKIIFIVIAVIMMSFTSWQTNFETALKVAKEKHQVVLLSFSGSDWCGPCIRMRKEIFESEVFNEWADTSLVLYNADFPRNKKNRLEPTLKAQNEALADRYNPEGKFPFTLLLDDDGSVIKSWDGFPKDGTDIFIKEVKCTVNAH